MVETNTQKKSTHAKKSMRGPIEIAIIVPAAIILAIVLRLYVVTLFYIPSESMVPTLKVNDKIFVNKLAYKFHDIERGDIVVIDAPEEVKKIDPKIEFLVKRVVGLPGETVEGKCDGGENTCQVSIYINGKKLTEPYLVSNLENYSPFAARTIPLNSIFVMGDNRLHSEDGREFTDATPKSSVIGRAFFRVWPLGSFGFL